MGGRRLPPRRAPRHHAAIRSGGRSPLRLPDVRTVGGARGAAPVPYTTMQYMQRAITHLIAGVPVSELGAAVDWYTRFFGRPPDARAGEEALWDINEHATLFIEPNAVGAGTAGSPSPSPVSTRSWSAWLPKASRTNPSRPIRMVSATRRSPTRMGTRSRSLSHRPRRRVQNRPLLPRSGQWSHDAE